MEVVVAKFEELLQLLPEYSRVKTRKICDMIAGSRASIGCQDRPKV